jgi:hypothetical protein
MYILVPSTGWRKAEALGPEVGNEGAGRCTTVFSQDIDELPIACSISELVK